MGEREGRRSTWKLLFVKILIVTGHECIEHLQLLFIVRSFVRLLLLFIFTAYFLFLFLFCIEHLQLLGVEETVANEKTKLCFQSNCLYNKSVTSN